MPGRGDHHHRANSEDLVNDIQFNLLGDLAGLICYALLVELNSRLCILPLRLLADCTLANSRISNSLSFYIQVLYGIKTRSFFHFGFQVTILQAVHAREDHRT
jgi:hypothetical protein